MLSGIPSLSESKSNEFMIPSKSESTSAINTLAACTHKVKLSVLPISSENAPEENLILCTPVDGIQWKPAPPTPQT